MTGFGNSEMSVNWLDFMSPRVEGYAFLIGTPYELCLAPQIVRNQSDLTSLVI